MNRLFLFFVFTFIFTAIAIGQDATDCLTFSNLKKDSMSTIKVHRSSQFQSLTRKIKILVDGEIIGKLAIGETKEFNVQCGTHTILAKLDWCKSQEVTISIPIDSTKIFFVNFDKSTLKALYQCVFEQNKYILLTEQK